jgi:tetratricopeptide (TPR) repeat protein
MEKKYLPYSILIVVVILSSIYFGGCMGGSIQKYRISVCSEYSSQENYEESLRCMSDLIKDYPDNPAFYYLRGKLYYDNFNQTEKALIDFTTAIDNYQNIDEFYIQFARLENIFLDRSLCYSDLKKYDEAIKDLNKSIEIEGVNPRAYNNLGDVYYKKQEYRKGIEYSNKSLQYMTDKYHPYFNRARCHFKLSNLDSSLIDYNKVISIENGYYNVYSERGDVYFAMNKIDEAINDWLKALDLKPPEDFEKELNEKIDKTKNQQFK